MSTLVTYAGDRKAADSKTKLISIFPHHFHFDFASQIDILPLRMGLDKEAAPSPEIVNLSPDNVPGHMRLARSDALIRLQNKAHRAPEHWAREATWTDSLTRSLVQDEAINPQDLLIPIPPSVIQEAEKSDSWTRADLAAAFNTGKPVRIAIQGQVYGDVVTLQGTPELRLPEAGTRDIVRMILPLGNEDSDLVYQGNFTYPDDGGTRLYLVVNQDDFTD